MTDALENTGEREQADDGKRSSLLSELSERDAIRALDSADGDALTERLLIRDSRRNAEEFAADFGMREPDRTQDGPVVILPSSEFRHRYVEEVGGASASAEVRQELLDQSRNVAGFVGKSGDLVVERGRPDVYATLIHEQLHRHSNPGFEALLGRQANEGATEFFTRQLVGEWKADLLHFDVAYEETTRTIRPGAYRIESYRPQVEFVRRLATEVGTDALGQAYFSGQFELVKARYDARYGAGAFERFAAETVGSTDPPK